MTGFYNNMSWPMYLVIIFGSSVIMFVVATLSFLRKRPVLITLGFFLLGCMSLTLVGTKIFNMMDMYALLLLSLPITMTGGILATKDNPNLNKKLKRSAIMMLLIFLLVVAIVLIKIIEK